MNLRRVLGVFLLCGFWALPGFTQEQTIEVPVAKYGTPTTVAVSTSAWTKVPTSSSLQRRTSLIFDEPATNTANMVGHIGGCSTTSIATTVRPIEIIKGDGFKEIRLDDNTCLWLLSLHTSAENVHVQELSQRN